MSQSKLDMPHAVCTTGIAACRDATKKGFRVQCLLATGGWATITSPAYNCEDTDYRVHPQDVSGYTAWYNGWHLAPIAPPAPASTARPHADLIKAWADGAEIEVFRPSDASWIACPIPSFLSDRKYRIKPTAPAAPKIPRTVFDKGAGRRKAKYKARMDKLLAQITHLHEQREVLSSHYADKSLRAGVFAKEHVE